MQHDFIINKNINKPATVPKHLKNADIFDIKNTLSSQSVGELTIENHNSGISKYPKHNQEIYSDNNSSDMKSSEIQPEFNDPEQNIIKSKEKTLSDDINQNNGNKEKHDIKILEDNADIAQNKFVHMDLSEYNYPDLNHLISDIEYSSDRWDNSFEHQPSFKINMRNMKLIGPWCDGRYNPITKISNGKFGIVIKATDILKDIFVAIKIQEYNYVASNELNILRDLRHPNIVEYHDHWFEIDRKSNERLILYIVMEYADSTDLLTYLKLRDKLPEPEARKIMLQIFEGINYAHDKGYCHRDLKLENILITDKGKRIIIADWAFAGLLNYKLKKKLGSIHYAAPELLQRKSYDGRKIDIWGIGVILYALVTGRLPFIEDKLKNTVNSIINNIPPIPYGNISAELTYVLIVLLTKTPESRPYLNIVAKYNWMKHGITENDVDRQNVLSDYLSENKINSIKKSEHSHSFLENKSVMNTKVASYINSSDCSTFSEDSSVSCELSFDTYKSIISNINAQRLNKSNPTSPRDLQFPDEYIYNRSKSCNYAANSSNKYEYEILLNNINNITCSTKTKGKTTKTKNRKNRKTVNTKKHRKFKWFKIFRK